MVPANETLRQRLYLTSPADAPAAACDLVPLELIATDAVTGRGVKQETVFHGSSPMNARTRPLTGREVLWIALGLFALVMMPNVVMTVAAVRTFSGLIVPNSYVASQQFDADRLAQQALGSTPELRYAEGALRLRLTDASGAQVRPATLAVTVGRPTTSATDHAVELVPGSDGYAGVIALEPGSWLVQIAATAADSTPYHYRQTVHLRTGS